MSKRKICFVAPNAYPLLQNNSPYEFMGGAEFQQVLLGHCLHEKGYEISFVTLCWGDDSSDDSFEGIKIFKTFSKEHGIHYLRFFYPRFFKTWKAMERADADIYYQRGATSLTAIVALFCRIKKKIFFFSGAHDSNFMIPSIDVPRFFDRKLFSWGLKNASRIFVQSKKQKEMLLASHGLNGIRVYNIYKNSKMTSDKNYVLWVSNIKKIKRPILFIEIAKKFPKHKFVMIGGCVEGEESLYETVINETNKLSNIEFLGFKSLKETEIYFDGASLFINTAEMEGFPNTFLQAWSRGIATISFIDIDGIVSKNNLGAVIHTDKEIELYFDKLVSMSKYDRQKIRDYFVENHSPDNYVSTFEQTITECLKIKPEKKQKFRSLTHKNID